MTESAAIVPPIRKDRKLLLLIAAFGLMLAVYLLPSPPPLERAGNLIELPAKGQACLAIMVLAVMLWVTEALPFAVTSLLVLILIPVFGIADYRSVVRAGFGDPVITFFIGVLMLSAAFTRSGLGTRLVYMILATVGTRTNRVLLGFIAVGTFISMWITDMAVAAMLLPVGVGLLRDAKLEPRQSNFGRTLMISAAFGPLIGGIATPAGTAANIVAIAQLKQLAGVEISFLRWMAYGVPASLLMIPLAWRLLLWLYPPELERLPIQDHEVRERLNALGPLNPIERRTLWIFFVGDRCLAVRSLAGGMERRPLRPAGRGGGAGRRTEPVHPGVRVMTWKEAEREIDWGGIMLIVAGLSLGLAVFEGGAARWLAWVLLGQITMIPDLLKPAIIVLAVAVLHMMFSSNTVTASIITPILVALAQDLHLDPWTIVAPAAFTSSLAFILVSEGPTTIIPSSSDTFRSRTWPRPAS